MAPRTYEMLGTGLGSLRGLSQRRIAQQAGKAGKLRPLGENWACKSYAAKQQSFKLTQPDG